MILKSLAKNFREHKWFEVTIEIIVVVIGIFLALQVDDWHQRINDRELEQEYLERLLEDMNGSITDYDRVSFWDRNLLQAQNVVLQSLRSGELREENELNFKYGLTWLGIHNPQRRRWGTVNELYATGNISLIEDLSLRSQIAQVGAWYDRNNEIVRMQVQRIIEMRARISDRYQIIRFESVNGNAEVEYDFENLANDDTFLNIYADIHAASDQAVFFAHFSMLRIQELRDQLASKLGKDPSTQPQLKPFGERPWYLEDLADFPKPD